jgi:hypothetical protein
MPPLGGWGPFRATFLKGAAITAGSTLFSVALAIEIECMAHRTLYYYAPHKYARVDQAYGLTEEQLLAVRDPTWQPRQKEKAVTRRHAAAKEKLRPLHETTDFVTPQPVLYSAENALAMPQHVTANGNESMGFSDQTVFVVPPTKSESNKRPTSSSFLAPLFSDSILYRQEILACAMTG